MKLFKKLIIGLILLYLGLVGFYKFMTYDRSYEWAKMFYDITKTTIKTTNFKIVEINTTEINSIKIPTEKRIKLKIQKELNKIGLMNYGKEYEQEIKIQNSENIAKYLNVKGFCLGDHLIAIEIEYSRLTPKERKEIKENFSHAFNTYKINWINLDE